MLMALLLMLCLTAASCSDVAQDADEDYEPQAENFDGRSFFFLGTLFRRWRDRWMAFHNAAPLYAGAAFPINGYFNCPSYGCNPAAIGPQPGGYYPAYYAAPLQPQPQQQQQQQQQHAQGNSNVYIYPSDQHGIPPYGPGFPGPTRQPPPLSPPPPLPLPLPPPTLLPPSLPASPQAGASSFGFGFGSGPIPLPGCGTNPMACALG
ncbi:splicing factor, proline- and glutamine-rich [Drosophila grimshawi]|uniref:GH19523 n=1 Tax=Drosophila grimshawi TaxID=7222 RepID=B4JH11_DROGR|nr:splicing factor, proline- and glutamine-rich [Drosophila grimshawi]EDV93789.1 GH19523 [Drosophila grimshawi]